jgi:hypothetical protein
MTTEAFYDDLRRRHVRVFADNGTLRWQAPEGALTVADVRRIKSDKPALLALLARAHKPGDRGTPVPCSPRDADTGCEDEEIREDGPADAGSGDGVPARRIRALGSGNAAWIASRHGPEEIADTLTRLTERAKTDPRFAQGASDWQEIADAKKGTVQ